MIDTDKYEGHTPGPWEAPHEILVSGLNHIGPLSNGQEEVNEVDAQLIADAPLILEAYKRLREIIQVQIVTPRSKDFFFQHYGKDDFEERWKEWADGIQDRVWGRKK